MQYADDGGDPAKAVTAAKQYIGQGVKIVAGTTDSGVASQLAPLAEQNKILYIDGPAATDKITGANRHTDELPRSSVGKVLRRSLRGAPA